MNYIKELNAFAAYRKYNKLSPGQIALWLAIIEAHNALGWSEWVTLSTAVLEQATGLTPGGIKSARKALAENGLIEVCSHGTKAPDYRIVSLSENNEIKNDSQVNAESNTQSSTQDSTEDNTQDNTQDSTEDSTEDNTEDNTQSNTQSNTQTSTALNKQNKTKVNKDIYIPPYNPPAKPPKKKKTAKKAVRDVFAEYAGGNLELLQALRDWEEYRQTVRPIRTEKGYKLHCDDLDRLAGDDAQMKIKIIEQSIKRGWQGLFALKDERPKAAEKPPDAKKEMASRYDYAEIRRRDRERLKRLAEEEI